MLERHCETVQEEVCQEEDTRTREVCTGDMDEECGEVLEQVCSEDTRVECTTNNKEICTTVQEEVTTTRTEVQCVDSVTAAGVRPRPRHRVSRGGDRAVQPRAGRRLQEHHRDQVWAGTVQS